MIRIQRAPPTRWVAYGAEVAAELRAGHSPNTRLFAGPDAWDKAKRWRRCFGAGSALVLPPGDNPLCLRWPPRKSILGDVTGIDGAQLQRLARALIDAGYLLAYLLDADHPERNLRVIRRQR